MRELEELISGGTDESELSQLIEILSKEGETRRLTSLDPAQRQFIFELLAYHHTYFSSLYKSKKIKPLIPKLAEIFMDLAVSETENKDRNLLQQITDIYRYEKIQGIIRPPMLQK